MRSAIRKNPVRVQLSPTSFTTTRDPLTRIAAATTNAADEGSPGTTMSSSSSSSTWATVMRPPSRSNGTRARLRKRSVWSRLGPGSVTVVDPEASIPAISTHDFTCALGTGSSYSMPVSEAPRTVSGGKRPSRASMVAPIIRSGSATRSTGRRRIVSSPSSVQTPPGCPASQPGRRRMSVPAFPTSRRPPVASSGACRPTPRTTTLPSPSSSTPAPRAITAESVERVSSESR